MGDRYFSYYPCPKCGAEIEEYDAPSCTMFVAVCDECDWRDPKDYFEVELDGYKGEPLGDIAWSSEKYAHIGPMLETEFAEKYPRRYAWWKEVQAKWQTEREEQ